MLRSRISLDHIHLSSKHMIVDIVRIDEGLVKYRNTFPGGPLAFFGDVAQNTFVIKNAIYTLQTLVGDGVVVSSESHMNCISLYTARYTAVMSCGNRSGLSYSLPCSGAA